MEPIFKKKILSLVKAITVTSRGVHHQLARDWSHTVVTGPIYNNGRAVEESVPSNRSLRDQYFFFTYFFIWDLQPMFARCENRASFFDKGIRSIDLHASLCGCSKVPYFIKQPLTQ
jgi:hypothetical protein